MNYVPLKYRAQSGLITEILPDVRPSHMPEGVVIVRALQTISGRLESELGQRKVVISLASGKEIRFTGSTILELGVHDEKGIFRGSIVRLEEMYTFAFEGGDYIDVLFVDGVPESFWIAINYVDPQNRPSAGKFVAKDDGDFAYRTKSGEKAERLVTLHLIGLGHRFDPSLYQHNGFFEIRYKGKRERKPDRVCMDCQTKFEVKKRNRDRNYRVSHSEERPFSSENSKENDYHVFVFPDLSIHFLRNGTITDILSKKQATDTWSLGKQENYDSYAQLYRVVDDPAPRCR